MRRLGVALLGVLAACQVPDKFYIDGGGGDDTVDASVDPDGGGDDTTAPETTIDSGPPALSGSGAVSIEFSANEPATFTCSLDGGAAADCDPPFEMNVGDGPHTFSVRATDSAGNPDPTPAEHAWMVDTVAPETTITTAPPVNDNSTSVTFEFASNEAGSSFECAVDPGAFADCSTGFTVGGLTDGTRTFRVRAIDPTGNVDATPDTHTWTTDTATPDTVIDSGPSGAVATANVAFMYSSPDAGPGATFECQLDGLGFSSCPASGISYSGLSEASHNFQVRVRDAGGNVDPSPAVRNFTVDVTAPNTTITSGPSGTVTSQTATFTFTSNEAGATFECNLDGGGFSSCPATHQITGLGQGSHTLSVRAVDTAGNTDASPATRTWTVDTVGPVVTFTSPTPPQNGTSGPYVTFSWSLNEPATVACELDGTAVTPCTSGMSLSNREGGHTFRVIATDGVGNVGAGARDWTVDCAPPPLPGGAAQFHFDEGNGQTLINALNPTGTPAFLGTNNQPETADPARTAAGRFLEGLSFTASNGDVVTWSPSPSLGALALTYEVWIRPTASSSSPQDIMRGGDNRFVIYQAPSPGSVNFELQVVDDAGVYHYLFAPSVTPDVWHQVIATFGANTARFYVDGALVDSKPIAISSTFNLTPLRLGRVNPSNGLMGLLDEANVAPQAISGNDVLERWCPL